VDIPLPEKYVEHEMEHARESVDNQLSQMRMSLEDYLESREQTEEEFEAELLTQSQKAVKVGFILDEVARAEELSVNQAELSYFVADQAQRLGVGPEYLARQLSESGQIGTAVTEVIRGKSATVVAERVKVTDEAGNEIDVKSEIEALNSDVDSMLAAQAAVAGEEQSDIDVDDLSVDVAGTIEGAADSDEADEADVDDELAEADADDEADEDADPDEA
jgi:trigger factor